MESEVLTVKAVAMLGPASEVCEPLPAESVRETRERVYMLEGNCHLCGMLCGICAVMDGERYLVHGAQVALTHLEFLSSRLMRCLLFSQDLLQVLEVLLRIHNKNEVRFHGLTHAS